MYQTELFDNILRYILYVVYVLLMERANTGELLWFLKARGKVMESQGSVFVNRREKR